MSPERGGVVHVSDGNEGRASLSWDPQREHTHTGHGLCVWHQLVSFTEPGLPDRASQMLWPQTMSLISPEQRVFPMQFTIGHDLLPMTSDPELNGFRQALHQSCQELWHQLLMMVSLDQRQEEANMVLPTVSVYSPATAAHSAQTAYNIERKFAFSHVLPLWMSSSDLGSL